MLDECFEIITAASLLSTSIRSPLYPCIVLPFIAISTNRVSQTYSRLGWTIIILVALFTICFPAHEDSLSYSFGYGTSIHDGNKTDDVQGSAHGANSDADKESSQTIIDYAKFLSVAIDSSSSQDFDAKVTDCLPSITPLLQPYIVLYQHQDLIDESPPILEGCPVTACRLIQRSSKAFDIRTLGMHVLHYQYQCKTIHSVDPLESEIVSKYIHVISRPTPTILSHDLKAQTITLAFSSPVRAEPGPESKSINASSFRLVESGKLLSVIYLGSLHNYSNIYQLHYQSIIAPKQLEISFENCFDANTPYGHCSPFTNTLQSAYQHAVVSWNASIISPLVANLANTDRPQPIVSISVIFDSPISEFIGSSTTIPLNSTNFRVSLGKGWEGLGWSLQIFNPFARSLSDLRVASLKASGSSGFIITVHTDIDVESGDVLEIALVGLLAGSQSGIPVDGSIARIDIDRGICCVGDCDLGFSVLRPEHCFESLLVFVKGSVCPCAPSIVLSNAKAVVGERIDEPQIPVSPPPLHSVEFKIELNGASVIMMYVGQVLIDPGINVDARYSARISVTAADDDDNDGVMLYKNQITALKPGTFKTVYTISFGNKHPTKTLSRLIKVRPLSPIMSLSSFTQAYQSITIKFTSPPKSGLEEGTFTQRPLDISSFMILIKKRDGSLSKAKARLSSVKPIEPTTFASKRSFISSIIKSAPKYTNSSIYILGVDWISTNWSLDDQLVIALEPGACRDSQQPYGECSLEALAIPLLLAPRISEARVLAFFGVGGVRGYMSHSSFEVVWRYVYRFVWRRLVLGVLGFARSGNEVLLEISFDSDISSSFSNDAHDDTMLHRKSFEATLLRHDELFNEVTQTTADVESSMSLIPAWILHRLIPSIVRNPYVVYREGPAVVGTGSLRTVNMGDEECGVPMGGTRVNILYVDKAEALPPIDNAALTRAHNAKVRYYIDSLDIHTVSKILLRGAMRRIWMSMLNWAIGTQYTTTSSSTSNFKMQQMKAVVRSNNTYHIHIALPPSDRPFMKGDILVMNIIQTQAFAKSGGKLAVKCRPMVFDIWNALLNPHHGEKAGVYNMQKEGNIESKTLMEDHADQATKPASFFSMGLGYFVWKLFMISVCLVCLIHLAIGMIRILHDGDPIKTPIAMMTVVAEMVVCMFALVVCHVLVSRLEAWTFEAVRIELGMMMMNAV